MFTDTGYILCNGQNCAKTIENHRWGKAKSGWFETKDGRHYCSDHTPDWVEKWRKRNAH